MNEASLKVLRMVADGKLSAEQANELLTVLGDERQPPTPPDHQERSVDRDIDDLIAMRRETL